MNVRKKGCDKNRVTAPFVANKRRSKAYIYGDKSSQVKNIRDCFTWLFLLLDAEQLFHNLLVNGVLLPTPRSQVTIFIKHEKLFLKLFLVTQS